MPITQERMISLCTEGLAQKSTLVHFRDSLRTILAQHRSDPIMALALIEGEIAVLQLPPADNLIAESVHWRFRRSANEKNRNRMRRKRGTQSHPINAPTSVIRALQPQDLEGLNLEEEYAKWNKGEENS